MHTPDEQAWDRDDLLEEITIQNVEDYRASRRSGAFAIIIRHPDLSLSLSYGPYDLPGTPSDIVQAFAQAIPELLRTLEARVPKARSAALPPVSFWDSVFGEGILVEGVVRNSPYKR